MNSSGAHITSLGPNGCCLVAERVKVERCQPLWVGIRSSDLGMSYDFCFAFLSRSSRIATASIGSSSLVNAAMETTPPKSQSSVV
jgi:hypothetical protein